MPCALFPCAVVSLLLCLAVTQDAPKREILPLISSSVYNGEMATFTCNYGNGTLMNVTVDAFNGTRKQGSLWCSTGRNNVSGTGILTEMKFYGCPSIYEGIKSVSMTMQASPFLELSYNCTATIFSRSIFTTITSAPLNLTVFVLPMVPKFTPASLDFSESDSGSISCDSLYGRPAAALNLTVSSQNGDLLTVNGTESVALILPPPLVKWDNATATCFVMNHKFATMTVRKSITIYMLPMVPKFAPESLDLSEGDYGSISCESLDGRPAAALNLTVSAQNGDQLTANGTEFVALSLPPPIMRWNSATATCLVTNHQFSNMTITNSLLINPEAANIDLLTLWSNSVYSGEMATLTCIYGNRTLINVTVDAFNGTRKQGSLWCSIGRKNVGGTGILSGMTFYGCPSLYDQFQGVSMTLQASPSIELNYYCTATISSRSIFTTITSAPYMLTVYVLPMVPKFTPESLVYSEGDSGSISCESLDGRPAAALNLTISIAPVTTQHCSGTMEAATNCNARLMLSATQ